MQIKVKIRSDTNGKATIIKAGIDDNSGSCFMSNNSVDKEKYPETAEYLERKSVEIVNAIRLYAHLLNHPDHVEDFAFEAKPEEVPKIVREFLESMLGESGDDSKD